MDLKRALLLVPMLAAACVQRTQPAVAVLD